MPSRIAHVSVNKGVEDIVFVFFIINKLNVSCGTVIIHLNCEAKVNREVKSVNCVSFIWKSLYRHRSFKYICEIVIIFI